jgi:hypothetical protein
MVNENLSLTPGADDSFVALINVTKIVLSLLYLVMDF